MPRVKQIKSAKKVTKTVPAKIVKSKTVVKKAKSSAKPVISKSGGVTAKVFSLDGRSIGTQSLPKEIFNHQKDENLILSLRAYLASQRKGTASTKTRAEVRGGGRKPWKQKGTGRARQGSIRSPQWRHGGIVHGPKPRDYSFQLTKKMKKQALFSALTLKQKESDLVVISNLEKLGPKTKDAAKFLGKFEAKDALLVLTARSESVSRAFSNLAGCEVNLVKNLNPYQILSHQKVFLDKAAIDQIGKSEANDKVESKTKRGK